MIKLYQFRSFWGLPNASPFCMKVETYLRYRNISYEIIVTNPRQSPNGEIPYVELEDGSIINDSEQIILHFEKSQDAPLDKSLDPEQLATAWFIRQRVEEILYWQITYMRWGDPEGWKVFLPDLQRNFSGIKGYLLPHVIRRMLLRQMAGRGLIAQNPSMSYQTGIQLLDKLSDYLGQHNFFLGAQIHTIDMSVYAFLANIIQQPVSNQLQLHAHSKQNLSDYCHRMQKLIWSDWQATNEIT